MKKDRPTSKQEISLPVLLKEAQKGCKDIKDSVTRTAIPLCALSS